MPYRRELLPDVELGLGNSVHVQAYRLSGLVPGALGFILADHFDWHIVFIIVALFMLVGIVMTLVIDEAIAEPTPPKTMRDAVILPFRDFIGRAGLGPALLVLAFLFLYKLGDNMATALQSPFFIDIGFTLTQIGAIAKTAGLIAAIVGGMVGGFVMVKLPINRALWLFGVVQIVSILGFAALSQMGANPWMLGIVVAFEYLPASDRHGADRVHGSNDQPGIRRDATRVVHGTCISAAGVRQCRDRRDRRDSQAGRDSSCLHCARGAATACCSHVQSVAPWNETNMRTIRPDEIAVGRLDELEDPGCREFGIGDGDWPFHGFVVRQGEKVYAYLKYCVHVGHPLNWSVTSLPKGQAVRHYLCVAWRCTYEIETSQCFCGPGSGGSLRRSRSGIQ